MKQIDLESRLSKKQKQFFGVLTILLLILFTALLCIFIGRPLIQFVSSPENFRHWVEKSGFLGKVIFVLMVTFQVVVAIIPGEPLEIGAGYAFGAIEGTILTIVGITLGSIIIFSLVRTIGIRLVEVFFPIEKIRNLKFLQDTKKFKVITFLIFFLPGTPKDLLSYFMGLTDISFKNWLLIASFARIPSVITSTIGGGALGEQKYKTAIIVFIIAVILSIIGYLIYSLICKIHNKNK